MRLKGNQAMVLYFVPVVPVVFFSGFDFIHCYICFLFMVSWKWDDSSLLGIPVDENLVMLLRSYEASLPY